MANAYTITSVQLTPSTLADPPVLIFGTVNGVAVQVQVWHSVYQANSGTAVGFQNWVSPLLLAAYNAILPPGTAVPPSNSWSQ